MRLGSKAKLTIGVGLIAACSFAFLGVRELGRAAKPVADAAARVPSGKPEPALAVLAATTRDIRTGETITADMIRNAKSDPAKFPTAVTPAEIIGKVATRDIQGNSLIPRTAIAQETKLAIRVPIGMRAISIDTTAEIAVAGLVRPGDRVDVQVVYPGEDALSGARANGVSRARTLLQRVPVLAVGEAVVGAQPAGAVEGAVSAEPPPARTVTLALSPEQVSELSLAKSTGALYLSLRNPEDNVEVAVAQAASMSIPRTAPAYAAPRPMQVQAPRPRPAARPASRPKTSQPSGSQPIELVVGGNSQVIYSGSGSR
ncbi:Flp pilus assembly protein CpaB [Novosphingobium aerophilum]|uniref:Flp pilus assembly protein CpaB n=1 Tax=Novosphingobium TaxID=165696 RepID=UPI0006C892CA|nr:MULTISPECIES: Flp pilus assembly protein CpaB [unclassified Novosphingobium]KPH65884.1 pilus assembly protein CpaB [Novosphingobium sp. ST904]MPS70165.1 Flp pilus assembly protein CpaB [Novosphingobium sp.]TCM35236.1 pilus assembly protein CpaB [Novosphingobium sp. ST904]